MFAAGALHRFATCLYKTGAASCKVSACIQLAQSQDLATNIMEIETMQKPVRTAARLMLAVTMLHFAAPAVAQTVNKEDVLGAVRLSSALIECGHKEKGVKVGQSAVELMPGAGLSSNSEEVMEAFVLGKQAVANGEVTCEEVLEHARRAGIE